MRVSHGKGQYIGGSVLLPILSVQAPHPPIADECESHLRGRLPDVGQNGLRQFHNQLVIKPHKPHVTLHMNRHQCDWPQVSVNGEEGVVGFGCLCGTVDGRRPAAPDEGPED